MARVNYPFNGILNANEVFNSLYNMIISQEVYSGNVAGLYDSLINMYRRDGSLLGDTKTFIDTDSIPSHAWNGYSEAANLLATDKAPEPKVQAVVIDKFRQIRLTTDNYLTKRAWINEGGFSMFMSQMLGWISDVKRIYETGLFNCYFGTYESTAANAELEVPLSEITATGEEKNRLEAQTISQSVADLIVDMKDLSRGYNEDGFLKAYDENDLIIVWNSKWANKITKLDIPTIFHNDGLVDKFGKYILPAKYFGDVVTSTNLSSFEYNESTNPNGPFTKSGTTYTYNGKTKVRTLVEADFVVNNVTTHLFSGMELPSGASFTAATIPAIYVENEDIICKVVHKKSFVYMSAFETTTEFFNARALITNHYLTFGHSDPTHLKAYPVVTVHAD